jgi:hypothetical protein
MSVFPAPTQPRFRVIRDEDPVPYDAEYQAQQPKTRSRRMQQPFVMAPVSLVTANISDGAYRLYTLLLHHRNEITGQCNPSIETLAQELNRNEKTIRRLLDELEATGCITREIVKKHYHYDFPEPQTQRTETPTEPVSPDKNVHRKRAKMSTDNDESPDIPVPVTGQFCPKSPDKNVRQTINREQETENKTNSSSSTSERTPRKTATEPTPTYAVWRAWADKVGLPEKAKPAGKDIANAKDLAAKGIGPEEAGQFYDFLVSDPYWAKIGVDPGIMLSQSSKWLSRRTIKQPAPPLPPDLLRRVENQLAENLHEIKNGNGDRYPISYTNPSLRQSLDEWAVSVGLAAGWLPPQLGGQA